MTVQYLQDEEFYSISNYAVSRNPLFTDSDIQAHFKEKMHYYLDPICNISAYNFGRHSFTIVLKLKSRETVEEFYIEKYGEKSVLNPIPETTYIFSQQMSNLQVSLVKKINRKYGRKGKLMASRYKKSLLETPEEVLEEITRVNNLKGDTIHTGVWVNQLFSQVLPMSSFELYNGIKPGHIFDNNIRVIKDKEDLVGQFPKIHLPELFAVLDYHQIQLLKCLKKHLE